MKPARKAAIVFCILEQNASPSREHQHVSRKGLVTLAHAVLMVSGGRFKDTMHINKLGDVRVMDRMSLLSLRLHANFN